MPEIGGQVFLHEFYPVDSGLRASSGDGTGGMPLVFLPSAIGVAELRAMHEAKNTGRATVHIGYDGRVHKYFKGPQAQERYENEVRVLNFLEQHDCKFVPRILESDPKRLYLVTSNCGGRVDHISESKRKQIFAELEQYGVRHDDAEVRNITYSQQMGRFCVIDFEFATILKPGYPPAPEIKSVADRSQWINNGDRDE